MKNQYLAKRSADQKSFVVPFGPDHPQLHELISMEGCGEKKVVIVKNRAVFSDFYGEPLTYLYLNHLFCYIITIIVPKPHIYVVLVQKLYLNHI